MTQHIQSGVCCKARNSVISVASSCAEPCASPVPALRAQRGSSPLSCAGIGLCEEQQGVRRLSLLLPTTMLGEICFPRKVEDREGELQSFSTSHYSRILMGKKIKNMKVKRTSKNKLLTRMKVKKGKLTETKGTTRFPQLRYQDQSACETKADRCATRRGDQRGGFDSAAGHRVLPVPRQPRSGCSPPARIQQGIHLARRERARRAVSAHPRVSGPPPACLIHPAVKAVVSGAEWPGAEWP